jgi:hypothetical protein
VTRGTVRREVSIGVHADAAWALVGDPVRLPEWFPGITDAKVDGDQRVITLRSGVTMPEQILTRDPILRRFQYRITVPVFVDHLSTIDVFDLAPDRCLVSYSCDADPAAMALIIGGAAGNALLTLRDLLEGST